VEYRNILIDTSIIIEYLRKSNKQNCLLYQFLDINELSISTITEFELYAGALDNQKRLNAKKILSIFEILPFNSDIAKEAAAIYQNLKHDNQLIGLNDIFIAATAKHYELPILTLNKKHFARITNLNIVEF
jgi:tRNA(fMet)-specific endonuclease VapC